MKSDSPMGEDDFYTGCGCRKIGGDKKERHLSAVYPDTGGDTKMEMKKIAIYFVCISILIITGGGYKFTDSIFVHIFWNNSPDFQPVVLLWNQSLVSLEMPSRMW